MFWLFGLALLSWVGVLIYMLPAVWSIYVAQSRRGDPARLVCLLFALLMIGFLGRRVIMRDTDGGVDMAVLLIAAIAVAGFTARTAFSYGRGRRV